MTISGTILAFLRSANLARALVIGNFFVKIDYYLYLLFLEFLGLFTNIRQTLKDYGKNALLKEKKLNFMILTPGSLADLRR